jgi:hypothetical protein
MGLIHSRASKKRATAEAKLLREQTKLVRQERNIARSEQRDARVEQRAAAAGDNPLRQPTLGGAISTWRRNRGA